MSDFARNLFRRSLPREHGFQVLQVEGKLPADLAGTLLRIGPGNFEIAGQPYAHPFDGDGVITALRVGAGGASGAVRLVRTAGLQEELAAGKILYGDAAAWWRRMRNVYSGREKRTPNVNLMAWQGRLFALNEGCGPVEIDPGDLATRGETDIDGAVAAAFCAHPHRVDARRTTYNVGLEYGPKTRMHVYAFPDAGPVQRLTTLTFSYAPLVHDFAATETHLIFFVSPVRLSMARHFLQWGGFSELFGWKPEEGSEVIVVPLAQPEAAVRFSVEPFFQWHFANAFHCGSEIVVDYVRFADMEPIHALRSADSSAAFLNARYHRASVDPTRRTFRSEPLSGLGCEFPRVHPRIEGQRHGLTWLTHGDLRAILALDPEHHRESMYEFPSGQWASEPVFAPRSGALGSDERDGYLLVLCHDDARDRGFVAVLDARDISGGPVARVWFDQYVTSTLHGQWLGAEA
jgi:all-trans-8'-apo-beta-carotenal 15,15'-oxygenase